jgi:pimeloyl-ACP methyl ester carboxylesterase
MSRPMSRAASRRPLVRALLAALLAVVTVLVSVSASAGGTTAVRRGHEHHPGHGAKPTIVLVHGAWADSSSWSGVIAPLQRAGYTVLAAPNPLRGLSADAAYVRDFLATVPGPIVLVGHSYGGAVITNAATGDPDVEALVYVDAFAPDEGETVNSLVGADSALAGDPATLFDLRPYPGAPAGDADIYLKPSVFTDYFAQDLPRRQALLLAATQRPLAASAGVEPSGEPAWRTIPSWYVLGTRDRIITPASQLAMAQRAGARITKVSASHVSLISRPDVVVRVIGEAVRAVE